MKKELIEIIKSGEIKDKQQAETFAEAAEWNISEWNYGDFRLKTNSGYAEIYGAEVKMGDEEIAVPEFPQKIRFFNSEMEEISFLPDEF